MDQKYEKFESTSFKDYDSAKAAAGRIAEKLSTDANRVRVRLRSSGKYDVVTYRRLNPEKKNAVKST